MKFELKNLSLKFDENPIFESLNISFKGPGIIGVLGPSGCGKSTLIRILAKLQRPTAGTVNGGSLNQGFVFQESHLLGWRNCYENVALPLELQDKMKSHAMKISKALKSVNLEKAQNLYPSQLSGGMKMRVSLARAFVTEPEVLFCDEPFSALDEIQREQLQIYLRQEIDSRQALCFFVTHSLSEALLVSDQIYLFRDQGRIDPEFYSVQRQPLSEFRSSQMFQDQLQKLREWVRGSFG